MSHEEREHRSAPVLTVEQVAALRVLWRVPAGGPGFPPDDITMLCDSHEALRAERDAALAEVALWKAADAAYAEWMRREELPYNSRPDMFAYRVEACDAHGVALDAARGKETAHE